MVVMTAAVCEVTGSAVGLDVFLDEFDGFVDRLIDQLAPVRFSVPAGAAGSDGPAPPACISVPAATDVDADIDRDGTISTAELRGVVDRVAPPDLDLGERIEDPVVGDAATTVRPHLLHEVVLRVGRGEDLADPVRDGHKD